MKISKKSNLPLSLKSFVEEKLKSNDAFEGYQTVKSSLLQTTKILISPLTKPTSNFKNHEK